MKFLCTDSKSYEELLKNCSRVVSMNTRFDYVICMELELCLSPPDVIGGVLSLLLIDTRQTEEICSAEFTRLYDGRLALNYIGESSVE